MSNEDNKIKILQTLQTTEQISNTITTELISQTETLNEIDNSISTLDKKLTLSEKLVRRVSSTFSVFWPLPNTVDSTKIEKHNYPTEFTKMETKRERELDFYNEVAESLDRLSSNANIQKTILTEHNNKLDTIDENMEHSNTKLKKTMRRIVTITR